MANYATRADLETTYGQDLVKRLADHDADGVADADVIEKALVDSEAIIDTYLGIRYDLPLVVIPLTVRNLCIDIALYRLAYNPLKRTVEMRQRYEDAVALLVRIADGKASIGGEQDEEVTPEGVRKGVVTFHKRV